jgi:hypothetical protein
MSKQLPDRVCSTKAKKEEMIRWVNQMLDRFQPDEQPASIAKAMELADKDGNIEPLRKALLQLTGRDLGRFLRRPKRKHGQHFSKAKKCDPVTEAAIDAKIVWWLWKLNYSKRPIGVNAIEIAAARHNVDVDKVKNKQKKISFRPKDADFGVTGFVRFPRSQRPILFWWDVMH